MKMLKLWSVDYQVEVAKSHDCVAGTFYSDLNPTSEILMA